MANENDFSGISGIELAGQGCVVDPVDVSAGLSALAAESDDKSGNINGAGQMAVEGQKTPQEARNSWYRLIYTCLRWASVILVPGWKITEKELRVLADLWADAFVEMWPEGVAFGAIGEAAIGTGELVGSRWGMPRNLPAGESGSDDGKRGFFARMFSARENRA